MVVEKFPNLQEWLLGLSDSSEFGALLTFLFIVAFATVAGLLVGFVVSSFRRGPGEAFYALAKTVFQAIPDWLGISPRRVWAIASLSIKENRRLFVVTLALFVVTLLVAGWFLNGGTPYPEREYLSFIFFSTQILITLFAVLVSAFSLPNDIISKTIYTVVTKPVRSSEIVLGRLVGFALLGTVLLAIFGSLSLIFTHRGLSHTHEMAEELTVDSWLPVVDGLTAKKQRPFNPLTIREAQFETTRENSHEHRVALIELANGNVDVVVADVSGHTHKVEVLESDPETNLPTKLRFGDAIGNLRARRPIYATSRGELPPLTITDEAGNPGEDNGTEAGVNVGEMWEYQKYIRGGTGATAIYRFSGITADQFDQSDFINLDLDLAVFRTYKGNIRKRVLAEIEFRNVVDTAETRTAVVKSYLRPFETEEFKIQTLQIPRKVAGTVKTSDGQTSSQELDFFEDLAEGGQMDVVLRCVDAQQYLGVARASVYFHAGDSSFDWNFARGFLGIWAQMLVVISLTIALSTFLKGPVVMIGTAGIVIFGYAGQFITHLAKATLGAPVDDIWGGGPVEALYRLLTQMNLQQPLPAGFGFTIIEFIDTRLLLPAMTNITYAVPQFSEFNLSNYLAYGYTIDNQQLMIILIVALTFSFSMTVFGYFCFKTREIAAS